MKRILFLLLTLSSFICYGQRNSAYVDGPANFRTAPNGDKLFSLNDNVNIQIISDDGKWSVARLICYVDKEALVDRKIIKSNTSLLDYKGDSIGFTYSSFEVAENYDKKYWKYDEKEKIRIALEGQTFEGNIKLELTISELQSSKKSYADTCINTYLNYREENGLSITKTTKCDLFSSSIQLNGTKYNCFVRKQQTIKLIGGAEGQESLVTMTISSPDNEFKTFDFSTDADDLYINGSIFKSVKYGCCGSEDTYRLFNTSSGSEIMSYKVRLYEIEIPNTKFKGYIGFTGGMYRPTKEGKMILGTIAFSDGNELLKRINFQTHSKEQFENILRFVPDMEFIPLDDRDKTKKEGQLLTLWSRNQTTNSKDIWNFGFKVHLVNDSSGEIFSPILTFKDAKVNNLEAKEITINID